MRLPGGTELGGLYRRVVYSDRPDFRDSFASARRQPQFPEQRVSECAERACLDAAQQCLTDVHLTHSRHERNNISP